MSRIFSYARVSTETQTNENQKLEIKKYIEDKLNSEFIESRYFCENISGSVPPFKRPVFSNLLNKLEKGDILVVSKVDRLGRNTKDVLEVFEKLHNEMGVLLYVIQFNIDFNSPIGKMFFSILATFAELERNFIRQRTLEGLARAKRQGKVFGRPKLEKILEKKGFSLADVMSMLATGDSAQSIANKLGVCLNSIYRLKEREFLKYEKDVNKYFEIETADVPTGSVILNVSFKNDLLKTEWFNLTPFVQKNIFNSIKNKDLKNRIFLLLNSNLDLTFSNK